MYLGEHWASDAVSTYLFASLWLAGTVEAHLFRKSRFDITRVQH